MPVTPIPKRALVLGGGGSAGNAWLIGVVAGLFDAGLDVTEADLIVGTSAGSTAAAQITSTSPTQLFADVLSAAPSQQTGPVASDGARAPVGPMGDHMRRTSEIIAAAADPADRRRSLGAPALGESTWWRASAAAVPGAFPKASATAGTSTAATGDPARMPIWQLDTGGCWCCHRLAADHWRRRSGACILQRRSTNYAPGAAGSKPSCRIASPATHSAPI